MPKAAAHQKADSVITEKHLAVIHEQSLAAENSPIDSPEQLWRWQVDFRQRLRHAMRLDLPAVYRTPEAQNLQTRREGTVITESFDLQVSPDFFLPVARARPADSIPELAVIDLTRCDQFFKPEPFSGPGSKTIGPDLVNNNWALIRPALRGITPAGAGRGGSAKSYADVDRLAAAYLHLNRTYAGLVTHDLIRLIDAIEQHGDPPEAVVTVVADESGAEPAAWLAALDQRVRAVVLPPWPVSMPVDLETAPTPPRFVGQAALGAPQTVLRSVCPRPLLLIGPRAEDDPPLFETLTALYATCRASERFESATHLCREAVVQFLLRIANSK